MLGIIENPHSPKYYKELCLYYNHIGRHNEAEAIIHLIETKFNEIQPRSILQKDDILLNIVGASIGRTAKFDLNELANINQAVCLIRLNKGLVNVDYILQFFRFCTEIRF